METSNRLLPIPLWLEYSRIKYELQNRQTAQSCVAPAVEFSCKTSLQNTIDRSLATDEKVAKCSGTKNRLSISLSPEKSFEEVKASALFPSEKSSVAPTPQAKEANPLKHSIQTLKKSIQDLKRNSQDLYQNISRLSSKASSLCSSPTSIRAKVYSKLARFSRLNSASVSGYQPRRDYSKTATFTDDKSVQADPLQQMITPNETLECVGKLLSFSQLAESKKDCISTNTPSIPEADLSEGQPSEVPDFDSSPRSIPKSAAEMSQSQSRTLTPSRTRHLTLMKPTPNRSPNTSALPRSHTMGESLTQSPAPGSDAGKPSIYFMKAVSYSNRYFTSDAAAQELTLGKQATQGIALKGKETEGGFRVFATAQDAMNTETRTSPKKGGRICLMKVRASGPSLRCFLCRISAQEVVFSSVIPLDVIPMIAANVLVSTPVKRKK